MCQPTHASSSSSGFVLWAMMRSRSFCEKHFSLPSTCLQYLPLPYMPSSLLASSVSSLRSASLLGAGAVSESFNNKNFLASSGGIFSPSKRRASSASCVVASVSFSFACADSASVSSVIKFSCTHCALLARIPRSKSCASAFLMNACASATVAAPLACVADDAPDAWLDFFAAGVFAWVWVNAEQAATAITAADLRIRCKSIAPPE